MSEEPALIHSLKRAAANHAGIEFYTTIKETLLCIPRTKLEVVFVDLELEKNAAMQCIHQCSQSVTSALIVALSGSLDTHLVVSVFAAGANGLLLKPITSAKFCEAMNSLNAGNIPLSPLALCSLVGVFRKLNEENSPLKGLTARERGGLTCLIQGLRDKAIGNLVISKLVAPTGASIFPSADISSRPHD